jgi:hypothetical protein
MFIRPVERDQAADVGEVHAYLLKPRLSGFARWSRDMAAKLQTGEKLYNKVHFGGEDAENTIGWIKKGEQRQNQIWNHKG